MFQFLRDPSGRFTLLAGAFALLALAGFTLPLLRTRLVFLPLLLLVAGLACAVVWHRRQEQDRYDLKKLFDTPPPDLYDEPYEDVVEERDASAPYCGWCDECYPPGTYQCPRCRRALS
jgi:hypothetical protein